MYYGRARSARAAPRRVDAPRRETSSPAARDVAANAGRAAGRPSAPGRPGRGSPRYHAANAVHAIASSEPEWVSATDFVLLLASGPEVLPTKGPGEPK